MAIPAKLTDAIVTALLIGGVCAVFGSLLIPAWQCYMWLRYGAWPELPLALTWYWLGWPFPEVEWVGVEKMLIWCFKQPTSVWVFLSGLAMIGGGAKMIK